MRSRILFTILCFTLISAPSFAKNTDTEVLRIAVASNFSVPAEAIAQAFTKATGFKVTLSSGSSGKILAQIENGAPYDIFISADQKAPEGASHFTYAIGTLVLWSENQNLIDSKAEVLQKLNFRKLAIANPDLAPYGRAAKQALQKLKLWDSVQSKLVRGENIAQTQQFILTGNADLGFVSESQIIDHPTGSKWIVPKNLYDPILQDAFLLTRAKSKPSAQKWMEFLRGKESMSVIQKFGYTLPK